MSCGFKSNDHNTVFAFVFKYLFSKGGSSPHVPNPGQFGQQIAVRLLEQLEQKKKQEQAARF